MLSVTFCVSFWRALPVDGGGVGGLSGVLGLDAGWDVGGVGFFRARLHEVSIIYSKYLSADNHLRIDIGHECC